MRNQDWRFVDYKDADVDSNNALVSKHAQDKSLAPYAQELPASRNPLDAEIRVLSVSSGRQFKFRVGAVQQYMNGTELKRLQLFLGASIYREIVNKNYSQLAQAAGSRNASAFMEPVKKVNE